MSPVAERVRRIAGGALTLLCVANALDLTTSLLPTHFDGQLPPRPPVMLALQCALLVVLAWRARRAPAALLRQLRALPLPRPAKWTLLAFVAVELVHVGLRMEIYPFSCVAMFSSLERTSRAPTYEADVYVQALSGDLEIFSFMREGNAVFQRHFDWDYKAAWLMRMYKGSPIVDTILTERLRAEGLPPPSLRHVYLRKRDGGIARVARVP